MILDDQNVVEWISQFFSGRELSKNDILMHLKDFQGHSETADLCKFPKFYYELSKANSEAAFVLWQLKLQEKLNAFMQAESTHVVVSKLFPLLNNDQILYLDSGKAFLLNESSLITVDKPLAFRKFSWREIHSIGKEVSTYTESELEQLLEDEIIFIAGLIAGAKYKSYQLAMQYVAERSQGGKLIKEWTSIQSILSELYLDVKRDEVLLSNLNTAGAFLILKDADEFVSLNMQVFGGAGYTEDYVVERFYRECIFLKNWHKPFRQKLIKHYKNCMRDL